MKTPQLATGDADTALHDHFKHECVGACDSQLQYKTAKIIKSKHLHHLKCFVLESIDPKIIYLYLKGFVSKERVLFDMYKLETKYQGKTLAMIHGLNSYVDWHAQVRRGDVDNKREKKLIFEKKDFGKINGIEKYLNRYEFERLIALKRNKN